MTFSKKCRKKEADRVEVRMEVVVLKSSEEVKYLGVTVDRQLTWKEHIDRVRKKCISGLSLLYKVKSALPFKMKQQLFESFIQPHLDYCAVVWAECSKESATKLERIQKAGMRMILNIHQRDFLSAVMRCKLGWMSLSCRKSMFRAKCTRKYIVHKVPSYMAKQFKTHEELGMRSTRRASDIYLPTPKSNWLSLVQ